MPLEIRVPTLGESVTEATVAKWLKNPGESVKADEPVVELETDKVTVEVPAPAAGVLSEILVAKGETIGVGGLLGTLGEGGAAAAAAPPKPVPMAEPKLVQAPANGAAPVMMPSAAKLAAESNVTVMTGTGKDGRILKGDVIAALEARANAPAQSIKPHQSRDLAPAEERVPMTRLRRTIALRLKEAQNTAAMLTTFNEIDMTAVMDMRKTFVDQFEKRHGVRLGFMSFFVKACISALKELPAVNAEIDGDDIIYKNHYDIGVAVGTDKGLIVPVIRNADHHSFADLEKAIADFGIRARDGKIKLEELQGGTFTISNGGVYGSLMSTPILNAPQSGILGMHKIEQRPIAVDGKIEIRPMMYVALSYDHRLVDGREAVTFLVRVKEHLEQPQRLLLDI
ncbi:MAG TPA: dihydrolipoamide succinyltransferase [Alphaproteobacteria bacterium]|nr:dihydrolipoamide succinyltransferase [Alphaproteobacteria bacterium]